MSEDFWRLLIFGWTMFLLFGLIGLGVWHREGIFYVGFLLIPIMAMFGVGIYKFVKHLRERR